MKIFIDSAKLDEIKQAYSTGIIDGVTTNPSLIKKAVDQLKKEGQKIDLTSYIKKILKVAKGTPVSLEVTETTYGGMVKQGLRLYKKFNKVAKNVYIKIPVNPSFDDKPNMDGIRAIKTLSKKGIPINCTLIFTPEQALLAAKAGARFVSPFAGRVEDYIRVNNKIKFEKTDYFPQSGLIKKNKLLDDNGIISGIGSVLVFFPSIFILFFSLSLLEDTGYLARIAFIMNNIMSKLGLSGKAFIPLLLGFGCNVPAILSTRTLSKKENRILTMLITPFMSCNARLPVFILIAGALFDKGQPIIIFSLYFLGILIAMISSKLISKILLKNSSSSFIIEFPPYRIPRIKYVLYSAWLKSKDFLKSAGTIIISMVLLIWFFASMPYGVEYASENSLIGILGKFISPIFRPLGFSNWKIAVALIFGFIAKEVIIGTLGTLFKTTNVGGLKSSMSEVFTQPSAISFMVFVLLYVPCLATLSAMKKESGSWKWPIFSVLFSLAIGWIFSFLIYNIINLVILWN